MITIIGSGAFGSTISHVLKDKKHHIVDVEQDGTYSADTIQKIKESDKLILCVPSAAYKSCLAMLSGIIKDDAQFLSCTKGLYEGLKTSTELIKETLKKPAATLQGPNISVEVKKDLPCMTGIAGDNANEWAALLTTDTFKPHVEDDAVALEFGGAIKNIFALGTGLIAGYYEKDSYNTQGSLVAHAFKDVQHLFSHKKHTPLSHPSFIGDLFTTCMSDESRNHHYGTRVGDALREKKQRPEPEELVEGLHTIRIVHAYAEEHKIPIKTIHALYTIFSDNGTMDDLVNSWQ